MMQNTFTFLNPNHLAQIQYQYNARELVYQKDKIKLYHYRAKTKNPCNTPLLVVFSTVNRPEILDLFPENSFLNGLLENDMDVYLLDWGYPDSSDKDISLSDYIINYLKHLVKFIKEKNQCEKINLIGICQGGILCLCYSILSADIKNLVLISTPIDFHTRNNIITKLIKNLNTDELMKMPGTISGAWLTQFFISLRPFELLGKKYLRFIDHYKNPVWTDKFLRVEKWLYDAPDQTRVFFSEFIRDFYQKNKLIKGEICINDNNIHLSHLNIPVLNVMAQEDKIVPVSASQALKKYVPAKNYSQHIFKNGHIGIYISHKTKTPIANVIAKWLKNNS